KHSSNGEILLSRRHFLYGAVGAGVLAASLHRGFEPVEAFADDEEVDYLVVDEESVFNLDPDCTEVAASEHMLQLGYYELPYGTLIWASGDTIAACLFPTETSKPLTKAGILSLGSGYYWTLLEAAVGSHEGFEIYDIRATEQGIIWTEANILSDVWRIYTATFNGDDIGEAAKVDEGDGDWETPTIAVVGNYAFWQVLPRLNGTKLTESSLLKRARFGSSNVDIMYVSEGRMSSPPYPLRDKIVITPRTNTDAVHHQLTLLDAETGETKDKLILPSGMKPLEAGYGNTGFTFSFDGIYNYGGGIANLGTYAPKTSKAIGDYQEKEWFHFNRSPTAAPCWCRNYFMVKSKQMVCGIILGEKSFFSFEVESGSDNYGDYLASVGMNALAVTFANINLKAIDGTVRRCCLVRVWAPL
ncbi:MAG: hypothetical protein LBB35_02320, partial [Coriobacteriaceae bacterium]|nr:hypothetical protein [Coriobacteriaceae bacterium]